MQPMSEASRDPYHSSGSPWQAHTEKLARKNSTSGFLVQALLIMRIPGVHKPESHRWVEEVGGNALKKWAVCVLGK